MTARPGRVRESWALALYAYSDDALPPSLFAGFFKRMEGVFSDRGVSPTHVSAIGRGYPSTYVTHGGRVMQRLLDTEFAGVEALGLRAARSPTSRDPETDSRVAADLFSWTYGAQVEVILSLGMDDALLPLASSEFRVLLLDLLAWRPWSFGFAIRDRASRLPYEVARGIECEGQRRRDTRDVEVWAGAGPVERQRTARGIYPVLVLNGQQLGQSVARAPKLADRLLGRRRPKPQTLADYIAAAEYTRNERVGDLLVWWIPERRRAGIRADLRGAAAVMAGKLPWDDDEWQAAAASRAARSPRLGSTPPPGPGLPNPARDALWQLIRARLAQTPREPPVIPFEAFFEGNEEEDSIAPNQVDYGRPALADMYTTLREIAARPDVQAVLVGLHEDTLHWLESGETGAWPEAENVHIITSASMEEVERWVEGFDCGGVTADRD